MNQVKPLANNASGTALPIVPTSIGNKPIKPVDNYTGVQGKADHSYKPSDNALVKNQVAGLLDPNSPLMRKAVSQSQGFAASRGLQSSSIANEAALSSMVDKAMPIAQQDANTHSQAEQLGWQQNWQTGENNLNRTHDASMADKQGLLQQQLQKDGQQWQSSENNLNRQHDQTMQTGQQSFQRSMQELQHQQSLGMLDAQGRQELTRMEKGAQLETERAKLLQQFQMQNMDKSYLHQLEQARIQFEQEDKRLSAQWSMQTQSEYRNAAGTAYNNYLAQVGAVYADPNMTNEQKAAGAAFLQSQMEAQRRMLETIYGFSNGPAQVQNQNAQTPQQPVATVPPVNQQVYVAPPFKPAQNNFPVNHPLSSNTALYQMNIR